MLTYKNVQMIVLNFKYKYSLCSQMHHNHLNNMSMNNFLLYTQCSFLNTNKNVLFNIFPETFVKYIFIFLIVKIPVNRNWNDVFACGKTFSNHKSIFITVICILDYYWMCNFHWFMAFELEFFLRYLKSTWELFKKY